MSTSHKSNLVNALYRGTDPFAFFEGSEDDVDCQGWGSYHPYLSEAIEALKPRLIIEIGVWKGASVIFMAEQLRRLSLDAVIIAIDTWRGSAEHWISNRWFGSLKIQGGICRIQETFMTNIKARGLTDYVLPLPLDSVNAFQVCKKLAIQAELIHIDAGHDYDSVSTDLRLWWTLLQDQGVMICDDYSVDDSGTPTAWAGVAEAVNEHVASTGNATNFRHTKNKCWISKNREAASLA